MRPPAARSATWVRRAAALAGAVGLILTASLAPATALIRPAASPTAGSGCPPPPGHPTLGATVLGPNMYDWKTHGQFTCPSTVTVSQTQQLSNQMVQVSWTGFTPSKGTPGTSANPYNPSSTMYPVEVAECAGNSPGSQPANLSNCYYGGNAGQVYTNGKFGPSTDTWATTTAQGTGYADIQLQTSVQNQQLGCDSAHNCSLLILPVQGGYPGNTTTGQKPKCSNHSGDGAFGEDFATAQATLSVPAGAFGDTCSWPYRIVVPLHFAHIVQSCGFQNAAFSVAGSPMLQRAMTSWQSGLCSGAHPDPYGGGNGSVEEPEARTLFQSGAEDVALTTEPATGSSVHPYTYAPVAISATDVAYWVDNAGTTEPYTNLKLSALLLTKMLTQSYTFGHQCWQTGYVPPPPCDPGASHDPYNLLTDPEFTALNGNLNVDETNPYIVGIPTVIQGNSDMTWEVTRWIAADTASTSFLSGKADNWGDQVNTFYLGTQFPTQQFIGQDPDGTPAFTYFPVSPLSNVVSYQAENWLPGQDWTQPICIQQPPPKPPVCSGYAKDSAEYPGRRQLFAILDQADAAAFMMPTMQIENAAGKYVGPSAASMAAAVKNMVPNGSNGITQQYNESSKDPAAYPLTMVVYAMVPTGGISHAKAAKIAQWLDYVAGPGQHQGNLPGQLPPGYLPLTASMRAQTLKAAYEVLHQTGGHSSHQPGGGTGPGGGNNKSNPGGTSPGGKKSSPGSSTGPSSGANPKGKANAAFSSPFSGTGRLILVLVLIVGGLLLLAGPAAVVLGKPGGRAAVIAGWRRVQALRFPRGRKQP